MEIDTILLLVKETPAVVLSVLIWLELKNLRLELVPVIHRLDERVKD